MIVTVRIATVTLGILGIVLGVLVIGGHAQISSALTTMVGAALALAAGALAWTADDATVREEI